MSMQTAIVGGGCFWCTEAVLELLPGVSDVESGYAGGKVPNPTYEAVCTGTTGHAEVVKVSFDSEKITYADILLAFMLSHDPTTLNRQGADRGTQYRSVIFYEGDEQKKFADAIVAELTERQLFPGPIVTEISPAPTYYPAEKYHQDYYANNPGQGYCNAVINPKVAKFRKMFLEQKQIS
jgi:peptide-methionine (S)-S-oxide reductase